LKTELLKINQFDIDKNKIKIAGNKLLSGNVIAFPTETVYGLGALISKEEAIKKIFEIKDRPADNPLIAHVSSLSQINKIAYINKDVEKIAKYFWPGPLTLILNKKESISNLVTAGLPTIGVRFPSNKIAQELITFCEEPIVAPSANISGKPSTTNAYHVLDDLNGSVDIIIDGGDSKYGLESTIIDLTSGNTTILRPGSITLENLSKVLKNVKYTDNIKNIDKPIAPGMKYKHYSPDADVYIINGSLKSITSKIKELYIDFSSQNKKVGILSTSETINNYNFENVLSMGSRNDKEIIAKKLFNLLREFDKLKVDIVLAESIDTNGLGYSIMNRLAKSAGFKIIDSL
jgi:L-threonylcarbamoyladenylate synthase